MFDQPRHEALESSPFFENGASAREPPRGTVPRGDRRGDKALASGVDPDGGFVSAPPFALSRAAQERGHERFDIFCSPCHGRVGDGDGMIVQRGFKRPPSFHIDRLRAQPAGYFVDTITNGFGVMPAYASQIPIEDRWAIAAYIGALQLSQSADVAALPPDDAAHIEGAL